MSSFTTYLIGYLLFVAGLATGAYFLNVPGKWIGVAVLSLIGLGVLMATKNEKHRDPPTT